MTARRYKHGMHTRSTTPHAVIIGGSIGGLMAGLLLRRIGWRVTICERSAVPLSGRGAGIVTHEALWQALFQAGLTEAQRHGVVVHDRVAFAQDGRELARMRYRQIMTSWDHLFGMLRALYGTADYHLGQELAGIVPHAGHVTARFVDGSALDADLIVGADGFRSTVRALASPNIRPVYTGYVGWRGMVEERQIAPATHERLFALFGFCLPPGEQMITYPVVGELHDTRPGHRRGNYVWYRPVEAEHGLRDLLTDARGAYHGLSIPPPLIRASHIDALRRDAALLLAPDFADLVMTTQAPFLQPIYDLASDRIAFGRVALLGDAAFQARPHVGAGVTKAALDAVALARALHGAISVEAGLEAYNAERVPEGQRIVQRARHLGAYMQAHLATEEEREAARQHHSPEAVIAETAVADI